MKKLLLPLLTGLVAAALPGQIHPFKCIVLVRCGVTDLVLNAPLVDGVLADSGCRERLRPVLGESLGQVGFRTQMPVAHLPGTFQIHVDGELNVGGEWTEAREGLAIDAITSHLQWKLDRLLFIDPQKRLRDREAELTEQLTKASLEQKALFARAAGAERNNATIARQTDALEQQLVATRVELATEESAAAHLEQLQAKNLQLRDLRRAQFAELGQRRMPMEMQIRLLTSRLEDERAMSGDGKNAAKIDALRAEMSKLEAEAGEQRAALERAQEQLQDAQRTLTVVLEQLPASALATHRARARLQSLMEERKALEERASAIASEMRDAAGASLAADRLGSEIAANQTQLGLVRSKLSQLEPVRCEVLRSPR